MVASVAAAMGPLGGGPWMMLILVAFWSGALLAGWLLVERDFLGLATVFLTFFFPMLLDFQVYEPDYPPPWLAGLMPGLVISARDLFLIVVATVWMVDLAVGNEVESKRIGWPARWISLFLICGLMFPIHTVDLQRSAINWFELFRRALAFAYIAKRVHDKKLLQWIVWGMMAHVWLETLIAGLQYATGSSLGLDFLGEQRGIMEFTTTGGAIPRAGGLLIHPNQLAAYLVIVGPVILAMCLRRQSLLSYVIHWATFGAVNLSLLITFSRTAWGVAAVAYLVTYHLVQRRYGRPWILSFFIPIILAAIAGLLLILLVEDVRDRLFMPDHGSGELRKYQFLGAFEIIQHYHLIGTGTGNYLGGIMHVWPYGNPADQNTYIYQVHNGSLLMTAEFGLIGGIAYHGFFITCMLRCWKAWQWKDDFLALLGTGLLVGFATWFAKSQYNVHTLLNDPCSWLQLALMLSVSNAAVRMAKSPNP